MATVVKRKKKLALSPEVKAFAKERGLTAYLPKIMDLLHELFSDATKLNVAVHHDPEIADLSWLLFEVEVPWKTTEQILQGERDWNRATAAVCPKPLLMEFVLLLRRR